MAPRTRKVSNRVKADEAAAAVDLAEAHEMRSDLPTAAKHHAIVPLARHRIVAEIPKVLAVLFSVCKAAVKTLAAHDLTVGADAKATNGAAVAHAGADNHNKFLLGQTNDKRLDFTT